MYKKNRIRIPIPIRSLVKLIPLSMKLSLLLLFAITIQVNAYTYGQKITLQKSDVKLVTVLKDIQKQSGYNIFYEKSLFPASLTVDVHSDNLSVEQVLSDILTPHNIDFRVMDKNIVLTQGSRASLNSKGSSVANLQETQVTGRVINERGEPLANVTISLESAYGAVSTDSEGRFMIALENFPAALTFRMIGYATQTIHVSSSAPLEVQMAEVISQVEEVVVVGYGTQKRELVTSAIGSFKVKDEDVRQVASPTRLLEGKVAGVSLSLGSGNLASGERVSIRGISSISAGNTPLYVVDGVPINSSNMSLFDFGENYSPLAALNHADIESIEVLKDAASAAIYGSRASNGVILITTKSGKEGLSTIRADINTGFSTFANKDKLQLSSSDDYILQYNEGQENYNKQYGLSVGDANYKMPISNPFGNMPDTDWLGLIVQRGYFKNVNTSFSVGSPKTQYYMGVGYTDQEGVIKDNSMKKYNLNSKVSHKFTDWLEVGSNNIGNYIRNNQVPGANLGSTIIARAIEQRPFDRPFKPNGDYYVGGTDELMRHNPIQILNEQDAYFNNFRYLGTFYGKVDFSENLSFKSSFSADIGYTYDYTYYNENHPYGTGVGRLIDYNRLVQNYITEHVLSYNKSFDKLSLDAILGHSFQKQHYRTSNIDARGFPAPSLGVVSVASDIFNAGGSPSEYAMESYFTRGTLSYDDRYIMTATLRADGSSKFSPDNRWGIFPSLSFGWNVSRETFMEGSDLDLKLRASYGKTGNQEGIGNYAYQALMSGGQNYGNASGISISTFGNEDLTWEKADQYDVGFDMSFFQRKLGISFDMYYKKTTDLLYSRPIHSTTGMTSIISNIGSMENKGVELSINSNLNFGEFIWQSQFNIAHNKNKILALLEDDKPISIGSNRALQVGRDIGAFYLFEMQGLYQYDGEVPQALYDLGVRAGDVRWNDVDQNNIINDNDRVVLGSSNPDLFGGWNNTFKYKGVQLDVLMTYMYGNDVYAAWKVNGMARIGYRFAQLQEYIDNRWTGPGSTNVYPRAIASETHNTRNSTRFLEDGSFIRMRALTLSYNFSAPKFGNFKFNNIRVFGQIDNVFLLTRYSGWDPEVNTNLDPRFFGVDNFNNPQPRTYNLGVNFNF